MEWVTVIIPAYNAERTIDETLRSVRFQTHRRLEVIVIDDGSTDATPQIAAGHAAADVRVKLIRQRNSGVAAARNRGIAAANGDLIAPIDADDLWHPTKIERQLAALKQGGDAVGLVYCWSALIDEKSQIIGHSSAPIYSGRVFEKLLEGNFCGNGSSVLMRKSAVLAAGGYDPSLRARGGEGCEDFQLYLRIATQNEFAVVPGYLTGYRQLADAMSADVMQMLRSWDLVSAGISSRNPNFAAAMRKHRAYFLNYLFNRAIRARRIRPLLQISAASIREQPLRGSEHILVHLSYAFKRRLLKRTRQGQAHNATTSPPEHFSFGAPT
jgi:glycosyltransferase involved in cell wall biosynthesis